MQRALAGFGGVARRFQHRGELDGVTIIDDYALLPPEIQATIRAAAEGDWGRIIAVFQPFRYARTALMWREFADAFVGADQVILTDVCGFHEQPIPGVTGHLILNAVLDAHPELPVAYFPHRAELVKLVPDLRAAGRPRPDPRWRRHHDARRRAARRRARRAERGSDRDRAARRWRADELVAALEPALPGRVERDAPLAGLTTYRVGGPGARCSCAPGARATSPSSPARSAGSGHRCSSSVGARTCSSPTGASRASVLVLEGEFEEIDDRTPAASGPAAPWGSRCSPAGSPRPASPVSSSTSASPGPSAARCA